MTSSEEPSSYPPVYARNLHKKYGQFTAVEDSSFSAKEGEVFGVVGPNGAGKTTTLKMLAGLIEPTSGEARVSELPSTDPNMRRDLGFLPEESPLYEDMTGVSYLKFFADLYDVPSEEAETRIHRTLDRLDLERRDQKIGDMSKGMTRKVAIARSLVNDPQVLIYDEPASGLDPLSTNHIIDFTSELAEQGKTVIFSAHNLFHVESVCDRVIIMNNGEIIARGTLDEIRDDHGETTYHVYSTAELPEAERVGDYHKVEVTSMDAVQNVQETAEQSGGEVVDIRTDEASLEDIFLSLSKPEPGEGADA